MKTTANGIDIRYDITGSGPWITFIHPLAVDLTVWDAQVAALASGFTVLRFDARGHGQTAAPAGAYRLEQMAEDVIGLLDALGVERTHLVGLSMGGMIAQHVALKAPGRLDRLVLAGTTSYYPPESQPAWDERLRIVSAQGVEPMVAPTLERWFTEPYRAAHPEIVDRIGGLIRATPLAGYLGSCEAIRHIDTREGLRGVNLPTLVLVGDQDAGTPLPMAEAIQSAIAGSRLEVISSAAHLSNIEQAAAFNGLVKDFLGGLG
ncbi:MAG: alpha/beta fold hydrolase [Rhodocyclaceae bacterium]